MKQMNITNSPQELSDLCDTVRRFVEQSRYHESESLIKEAMGKYPHAPQPHNLFGLLLETQGDHLTAMKHFRAAWALDPSYVPARQNMDHFASFYPGAKWAFDESDCPQEKKRNEYKIEYDEHGTGRFIRGDQ